MLPGICLHALSVQCMSFEGILWVPALNGIFTRFLQNDMKVFGISIPILRIPNA